MYWFIGVGVKNSTDIMVEATAFNTIDFTWRAATVEIYSLMGMVAGVATNLWPFCCKDLSSGVSSSLERSITDLSWILEVVEEVTVVLKVFVVLEAILQVVVELWRYSIELLDLGDLVV